MTLQVIMQDIATSYAFTPEQYPELVGLSPKATFRFAIRHNALHMGKALGTIATCCETTDHGANADRELLEKGTIKMLINVLRVAELQGMNAETMLTLVAKYMR